MNQTTAIVAAVGVGLTLCLIGGLAVGGGVITGTACAAPATASATTSRSSEREPTHQWNNEQVDHATTIVTVGQEQQMPPRGWVIALATAMQESGLRNLDHLGEDNDRDSLGLFQQRPSQGWGSPEQLLDPAYAAGAFYDALVTVDGWEQMPLTEAAQAVKRSSYPDAYAKWEPEAVVLAAEITGTSPELLNGCGAGGWVFPWTGRWCLGSAPLSAPPMTGSTSPPLRVHRYVPQRLARWSRSPATPTPPTDAPTPVTLMDHHLSVAAVGTLTFGTPVASLPATANCSPDLSSKKATWFTPVK